MKPKMSVARCCCDKVSKYFSGGCWGCGRRSDSRGDNASKNYLHDENLPPLKINFRTEGWWNYTYNRPTDPPWVYGTTEWKNQFRYSDNPVEIPPHTFVLPQCTEKNAEQWGYDPIDSPWAGSCFIQGDSYSEDWQEGLPGTEGYGKANCSYCTRNSVFLDPVGQGAVDPSDEGNRIPTGSRVGGEDDPTLRYRDIDMDCVELQRWCVSLGRVTSNMSGNLASHITISVSAAASFEFYYRRWQGRLDVWEDELSTKGHSFGRTFTAKVPTDCTNIHEKLGGGWLDLLDPELFIYLPVNAGSILGEDFNNRHAGHYCYSQDAVGYHAYGKEPTIKFFVNFPAREDA